MQTDSDSPKLTPTRPRIAVVLGSGGIKAFAAIALFEFLRDEDIPIDLLVGCSGGGLVAAAVGAGYGPADLRALLRRFLDRRLFASVDYRTLLGLARLPFGRFDQSSGILKPDRVLVAYHGVFGDRRIEDLRPTTRLQATNTLTGEGVVLDAGPVAEAVYASGAMFPLLPPIQIGPHWLADGAYSSSLPIIEAVHHQMDVIIAVAFGQQITDRPRSFVEYFGNFLSRTYTISERREMALAIDLHHHEIVMINIQFDRVIQPWNVDEVPAILAAGHQAVDQRKTAIRRAIASFAAP